MEKTRKVFIRTGGSLSWNERECMIRDYLSGKYSKIEVWKKYTGQDVEHGQMLNWMRKLGYIAPRNSTRVSSPLKMQIQNSYILKEENLNDESKEKLLSRIKELEKMLEMEKLRTEGYELMIDIAERELKIPIRKKSNTK